MAKRRRKPSDIEIKKMRKEIMIYSCITADILILYFFMLFGHGFVTTEGGNLITVCMGVIEGFPGNFYQILPTHPMLFFLGLLLSIVVDIMIFEAYMIKKDIVANPNGDAAFEENFDAYNAEFVINPKIVEKVTGQEPKSYYDEEHKKIVISPKIKSSLKNKVYRACWDQTQLYADKVALSLDGTWCQRNSNAMIFGASGSGKSRFFLNPNLLQANSNYVVTDPSGEIILGYGAFLRKEGYIVKCLNISDMSSSCRFNPLQYIKDQSDIPVIVTTLMENTQKQKGSGGGDGDFWQKTTQALLCAIIGYLYEVEPMERRNFYNVLEMLRMAQEDEDDQNQEATDFDKMFEVLGKKNPNSYAYHQYQTYSLAPRKTALNILISTAVLLSTYVDIPEFNNLTFKDEMELDKFGAAPYKLKEGATLFLEDEARYEDRYESGALKRGYVDVEDFKKYRDLIERDKLGRYIEGDPYKMAVFLCIPTADTTYNWLTAMVYSLLFKMVYRRGETRAKEQVMSSPKLAYPARFLIDECANIGKIPNLQEYLATCRKYMISIVPIFQSFSQIQKVYGKEDANSIYANCDTTLFLGGVDGETLKIVCDRLGKESVKGLTNSVGGKKQGSGGSTTLTGRELMSRIQVEQMSNAECLVFIRALKPFKVKKFNLNAHPNFKYTAEADPEHFSFVNPFHSEYDDAEIEAIRIKKVGEDGYIEPVEINSARLRASKKQANEARKEMALSLQRSASVYGSYNEDDYMNEKDRKEAKANHEAYIEAMKSVYTEATKEEDTYTMDVIASTCLRYHIDIGIDFGDKRRNSRDRSTGSLYREDYFDEENLMEKIRHLSEEEAVEELKGSILSNTSFGGITTEFDIATLEQVAAGLGSMVKTSNNEDMMRNVRNKVNQASNIEILNKSKDSDVEEDETNVAIEKSIPDIYKQTQDGPILDLDFEDEDNYLDEFDATIEQQLAELDNVEVEEDSAGVENVVPTEEELNAELSGEANFTDYDETDYSNYDDSGNDAFFEYGDNEDAEVIQTLEEDISSDEILEQEINIEEIIVNLEDNNEMEETDMNETKLEKTEDKIETFVAEAEMKIDEAEDKVEAFTEETEDKFEEISEAIEDAFEKAEDKIEAFANKVEDKVEEVIEKAANKAAKVKSRFMVNLDDDDDDEDIV